MSTMTADLCADPEVPSCCIFSEATLWTQPKRYDSHPFCRGNRAFTLDVPILAQLPGKAYTHRVWTAVLYFVESLKKLLDGELWKQAFWRVGNVCASLGHRASRVFSCAYSLVKLTISTL